MTKLMQKIMFFVAMLTFANAASAVNETWPYFATYHLYGDYSIDLKLPLTKESVYKDGGYEYMMHFDLACIDSINESVKNDKASLIMMPTSNELNESYYMVYVNNQEVDKICISRTEIKKQ